MLAKQFRLPSSVIFTKAHTVRYPFFLVKYQQNQFAYPRFGFVLSKGIDKRAVVRNRIKRIIRTRIQDRWMGLSGKDVLFLVKPGAKTAQAPQLGEQVDAAMSSL